MEKENVMVNASDLRLPVGLYKQIMESVGRASVCWKSGNIPGGEFDSSEALVIAQELAQAFGHVIEETQRQNRVMLAALKDIITMDVRQDAAEKGLSWELSHNADYLRGIARFALNEVEPRLQTQGLQMRADVQAKEQEDFLLKGET